MHQAKVLLMAYCDCCSFKQSASIQRIRVKAAFNFWRLMSSSVCDYLLTSQDCLFSLLYSLFSISRLNSYCKEACLYRSFYSSSFIWLCFYSRIKRYLSVCLHSQLSWSRSLWAFFSYPSIFCILCFISWYQLSLSYKDLF